MAREKFEITPEQIREFQEATLMDDVFMKAFFEGNIPAVQKVLCIIMDKPDLIVISVSVQEDFRGFDDSHGVRFDVYAIDSEGRQYDIEFQNKTEGATPFRADFNAAMMTVRTLRKGENYSVLSERERVVIFITKTDVLKGGLPLYTIGRAIRETGETFNDGVKIIYVNTSHKDASTAIGRLIHDFRCRNANEWYYTEITERARYLKGDEGLMKEIERGFKLQREEGIAIGKVQAQENIALGLIRLGKNALEEIASVCNLSLEQVQTLANTVKA